MSNAKHFAGVPLTEGGTPTEVWTGAVATLPRIDLGMCGEMVIVAPHPDDETLGLGATAVTLGALGVAVQVVAVSDGGAARPCPSASRRDPLEDVRRRELHCALKTLGLSAPICLGLPDGELGECESTLACALGEILAAKPANTWCAATWRGDGHPDHEAVGRAAAAACDRTGAVLVEYPVWMWHWACPGDAVVPWHRAAAVPLSGAAIDRKNQAVQCFRSQTGGPDPMLPAAVLDRLLSVGEVVFR